MRKLKLFLDAKAANTPPRGISKASRVIFSVLTLLLLSVGNVWATDFYVKVTSAPSDWTGDYLIVYEAGNVAFNGGLTTLDATNNSIEVTISDGKIEANTTTNAAKFTISADASESGWYQLKSASGYYIAGSTKTSKASNGIKSINTEANKSNYLNQPSVGQILSKSSDQNMTLRYNSAVDQKRFRYYKSGQQAIALYKFEAGESDACATPTFSPAAGAVASGTQVIISCSTEGAAIHYTTDGSTPTASSATYSSAITVSSAMTIKAIAVKDGLSDSEPATASYTILEPKTIAQIMPSTTTEGDEFLLNDVTVTYAYGSNVYVKDASGYMLVYSSISGAANGKVLQGLQGKAKLYNQLPEISTVTKAPTVTDGSVVAPETLSAYPVATDLNKYVTMEEVTFASAASLSGSVTNVTGSFDGSDLVFRNTFKLSGVSLTAGTPYRVVGIVQKYNDNFQVYPISFEEIVGGSQVATPTFSPAAGTYTAVQNVTISTETADATIYYTTNGDEPTTSSTLYEGAISVGEDMTIKAIGVKEGLDNSNVASAAYTINLPLPEHTFQVTHHFSTGEGFEFPTGWGSSYAEHEIAYTDDKVHFASASHQSSTITDRPVTKDQAISLILTNSHKLISAVRFDYAQWGTKAQTLTMKYSTDGGETYSNFDPVVSSTDFALQILTMPEGVNAIQVTGSNSSSQVGLTSIAFDLEDKPIVTKTVTITTPSNGTLVVKNGDDAIASGDAIEVNTVLAIEATPAEGYKLTEVTVNGSAYTEETLTLTENVTIAATFEENLAPLVTSYDLSEIGVVTSHLNGERVGDKVNLPLTAASCSKVFRGWDKDANCAVAPEYAPGAEYTLEADNILYAVYADPSASATWNVATSLEAGDVVVISTNTGYTAHDMKTAGAISSSLFSCLASTYNADNSQITALAEGTLQFTVGGNATDGWTLMNGTKYLKVTAAKKVNLVDDEETWNISFSGNNATLAPKTGNYTGYSVQYNYNSGNDRFTAYNTTQVAISLYKQVASYSNYSTDCQAAVATPTFSPVAGTYTEAQNVTISSETTGATIYYTTDGTAPSTSATLYEGAITVDESKTLKAIAVKSGMANSAVATAEYTINLPLSTMDQIFAAATAAGGTATDVNITFGNWVVSGVSTNGKNVFVTDGTKGFIIFDNGGNMGFAADDVLSGTVACKVQLFKESAELTALSSSTEGLSVATGGVITPVVKTIDALSGINTGAPVIINSVQFDGTNLSDGANEIKPYNSLFAYDALENGKYYNVTGIYQQFDATKEILPRSAADIAEIDLEDPEISYSPATLTITAGDDWSAPTFNNENGVEIESYVSDNEAVATVTDGGVIALAGGTGTAVITAHFAGNATYAAANATYTITVNPVIPSENVVILAVYDTKYYAMSTTIPGEAFTAIEVEYDGSQVIVNSAEDKAAIQWTKKTSGDNTTFQTKGETPMYMKGTSGGTAMSLYGDVCNWSWDGTNEYYYIGSRSFFYQNGVGFKNYATSNFNKSGYSGKAQVIVIAAENIVITSKVSAELAYGPASDEITQGDAWTAPDLVNPHSVTITSYASDNEAVATVTDGGLIALAGGIGTAHITAHFDGDASYLEGDAVYTITVNAVPEPADVCDGTDDFLDTEDKASPTNYANRSTPNGWSATNAGYKVIDEKAYWMINGKTTAVGVITSPELSDGIATLKFRYANTNSESNGVSVKIEIKQGGDVVKEYTLTKPNSEVVQNTVYTELIENINVAGTFQIVITNLSPSNNTGNKDRVSIGRFCWSSYDVPTDFGSYQRTGLTSGNYGTICLPQAGTIEGATLYEIGSYENEMIYVDEVLSGELEAGKPYIFQATADQLNVTYTSGTQVAASSANGLHGFYNLENMATDAADKLDLDEDQGNYILYQNAYWLVSGRAAYINNFRAYIKLGEITSTAQAPGRRRVAMAVHGEQTATGVDAINAAEAPVKMMIDGQIYILRGEKMYDVTGKLVK